MFPNGLAALKKGQASISRAVTPLAKELDGGLDRHFAAEEGKLTESLPPYYAAERPICAGSRKNLDLRVRSSEEQELLLPTSPQPLYRQPNTERGHAGDTNPGRVGDRGVAGVSEITLAS